MKKLLLLLIVYTTSFAALKAQGTWTPRDTLPDTAMFQGITGFSIGNYGYAGLGDDEYDFAKLSDKLWRFDPSTNSWAQMANFPGSARVAPASFVIGNKAYVVTGSVKNNSTCVTECWAYDAITNTWAKKTNFPGSPRTYATGFAIGGKGYVGTGANETHDFYKDFYAYDTITDTWTRIADFGGVARNGDCGFAVNGKGYVCFGQDSTNNGYNDIWEYDTGSNTWTQKSSAPKTLVSASGFVICNNIYIGSASPTDYFGGGSFNAFWKYDAIMDSWTQVASVPGVSKIQGAAFAIADSGYYGFGDDSVGRVPNVFDKFYAGDSCSSIMTGNENIINIQRVSIYPNPNNGIFTIVCNSKNIEETPQRIEIYNEFGRVVANQLWPSNNSSLKIDISDQPQGIYILSMHYNNIVLNKKLIIQ